MSKNRVVYLTEDQIDALLGVAHRISMFQHKNDAGILFSLVQSEESE